MGLKLTAILNCHSIGIAAVLNQREGLVTQLE